jgi:hypothetical protein
MTIDTALFSEIAQRVISSPKAKTSILNLGKELFQSAGRTIIALQQNPNTGSKWAALARENKAVCQFKDVLTNKYIAVSVDGVVKPY